MDVGGGSDGVSSVSLFFGCFIQLGFSGVFLFCFCFVGFLVFLNCSF